MCIFGVGVAVRLGSIFACIGRRCNVGRVFSLIFEMREGLVYVHHYHYCVFRNVSLNSALG